MALQTISISNASIAEIIRGQMAEVTASEKGLMSNKDMTARLTQNNWDEFVTVAARIGVGNSVLFSSIAWVNNGFGTTYPSGIVTNKGVYYTVWCIAGKTREYNVNTNTWGDIF